MTGKPTKSRQLVLTNDSATGRIRVSMEAFFDFSFWMAEELEELIRSHRSKASANDLGLRRTLISSENEEPL